MKVAYLWSAVSILTLALCCGRAQAVAPLVPQKPIVVPGGAGRYDYMVVDAPLRRLLASHKGTGTLVVLDLSANRVLASVPTGEQQGIAVDAADQKYFVGDEKEQKVVILDRRSLKKIGEVSLPGPVDAVAFEPRSRRVYADHDDGQEVWVIDARTHKVVGKVPVPGAPEWVEYDPRTNRLYQNIKANNTVQVIDPSTDTVVAVWSTAPAESPHGLAVDSRSARLFTAGSNGKLAVLDLRTGKRIASVDIAKGVDQIAFDPGNRRVYCACAGFISVVQETAAGAKLLGNVAMPRGSHTLAVDPRTHAVWISYADSSNSYLQEYRLP